MGGTDALAFLACSGCAHKPVLQTWRLVNHPNPILIPPDVPTPDLTQRKLTTPLASAHAPCPSAPGIIDITIRRKRADTIITAAKLTEQPQGWLATWATQLEAQNCLAPGEGIRLANRIVESIPLDPSAAFRLLNSNDNRTGQVEIVPQTRLEVVSPLWRDPTKGMIDGASTTTGKGLSLTVTAKSSDNLLGYEKSLYLVRPKPPQSGSTIVPLYADRTIQGATQHVDQPTTNYFQFPADAAYYRLFWESTETEYAALVVAARTPAELDQRAKLLEAAGTSASCAILHNEMCAAIPKDVAVNPLIAVTVNGAEVLLPRRATVRSAIISAGEREPASVLNRISIDKPWNARLIHVTFNPGDAAILNLMLLGGEIISWR